MSIDSNWNALGVTPLDLSAMSASESIVNASQDTQREQPRERADHLGGTTPPLLDIVELSTNTTVSDGPGFPLTVSGSPTDYDSGMMFPVAATITGTPHEQLAQSQMLNQLDQSFASNLAAHDYTEAYLGRIVDYTA